MHISSGVLSFKPTSVSLDGKASQNLQIRALIFTIIQPHWSYSSSINQTFVAANLHGFTIQHNLFCFQTQVCNHMDLSQNVSCSSISKHDVFLSPFFHTETKALRVFTWERLVFSTWSAAIIKCCICNVFYNIKQYIRTWREYDSIVLFVSQQFFLICLISQCSS